MSIYYIRKNISRVELNHTIIEKEFIVVVYAISKSRHHITKYLVYVHIDHSNIKYLINKPNVNGRIIRWLLLLQEFDLTIVDKLGKHNVIAYFLLRLPIL